MAGSGDMELSVAILQDVVIQDPRWMETMQRLPQSGRLSRELLAELESRLTVVSPGRG
jgi:hypothetical protein